jgi:hypothetical protein
MRVDVLLPFVETVAGDDEFTGNLGGRSLTGVQELYRLSLELRCEPSSLPHVAPPRERIVPPFEVSVKPGLAQGAFQGKESILAGSGRKDETTTRVRMLTETEPTVGRQKRGWRIRSSTLFS